MHDPLTVAFEIKSPFKSKKSFLFPEGRRNTIVTIWHKDPELKGDDDSCGWFLRSHHIDKKILEKVKKSFQFEFEHNNWFNEDGYPKFSSIGIGLNMYSKAAWEIFMYLNGNTPSDRARRQYKRFMRKNLFDIILFSENPSDSIHGSINMIYGKEKMEERIDNFTSIITADIFRKLRKWYQHPRWHIWHWRIQIHPLQNLKRRFWDKCSVCGKRGFKAPGFADWNGTKVWHEECDNTPTL